MGEKKGRIFYSFGPLQIEHSLDRMEEEEEEEERLYLHLETHERVQGGGRRRRLALR